MFDILHFEIREEQTESNFKTAISTRGQRRGVAHFQSRKGEEARTFDESQFSPGFGEAGEREGGEEVIGKRKGEIPPFPSPPSSNLIIEAYTFPSAALSSNAWGIRSEEEEEKKWPFNSTHVILS